MARPRQQVSKADRVNAVVAERKAASSKHGVRPRWGRGFMLTPQEEEAVVSTYRSEPNISFAEMARRFNCSTTTITRTLDRKGVRRALQI